MAIQVFNVEIPSTCTKPIGVIYNNDKGQAIVVMADTIQEAMDVTSQQIEDVMNESEFYHEPTNEVDYSPSTEVMSKNDPIIDLAYKLIPLLDKRIALMNLSHNELVGKKVMAIKEGFGAKGQVMLVHSVNKFMDRLNIEFVACDETFIQNKEHTWSLLWDLRGEYLILYNEETDKGLRRIICFNR